MPKLTLNVDKAVIAKAKALAEERGISVSALFCQMVAMLSSTRDHRRATAPITRRLRGIAKAPPARNDRELFEAAVRVGGKV